MKKNILLGTNHKTGTVWLGGVFRLFCRLRGVEFFNISNSRMNREEKIALLNKVYKSKKPAVIFDNHSAFPLIPDDMKDAFKGIHMIRNPRDILISCALYHAWSEEKWLHVSQKKFNGQTYQEKINSISSIKNKLEFEMKNSSKNIINNISSFDAQDIFLDIRFETLMKDYDLYEIIKICRHLELEGEDIIHLQTAFYEKSLFGKKDKNSDKHIQSDNKKNEYKKVFDTEILDTFNVVFKQEIENLGY